MFSQMLPFLPDYHSPDTIEIRKFVYMAPKWITSRVGYQELIFQLILHVIVLIFDAYDRRHPQIELHETFFFANHALGALVINYLLLPRYLYPKKYLRFFVYFLIIIFIVLLIEEGVLERLYYPETRGRVFFRGLRDFNNLLDVLPPIFILSGFKFAWDALRKQSEVESLKDTVKESELEFLKSQINPHFLFNNLNNLYSYAIKNAPETPDIILELSEVLRYMLYECRARYVLLSREIEQINNFINLGKLQIKERGTVVFNVDNAHTQFHIAPLILIVFVENAFKHSSSSQSDDIRIDINLSVNENGFMTFICKNSYQEQSNTASLSNGIGLENVKKRLNLLYPETHTLQISNSNYLFKVEMSVDLNEKSRS